MKTTEFSLTTTANIATLAYTASAFPPSTNDVQKLHHLTVSATANTLFRIYNGTTALTQQISIPANGTIDIDGNKHEIITTPGNQLALYGSAAFSFIMTFSRIDVRFNNMNN